MSENKKISIAIIGLNFGACFAELYAAHPDVSHVGLCDTNPKALAPFDPARFSHHADFAEVLKDRRYDAVHLCLPITKHVDPTLAALRAGKHVACAVPMAHTLEDLERVIAEQKKTGLNYMMMETAVYGADYFLAKDLYREKQLGEIQFLRGCHSQDLEPFNPAWRGLPPMWYMTHAVSPLLDIIDAQAEETCCFGSGSHARPEFTGAYGNPYPIATAIFSLRGTTVKAEVTRTLFDTAPYGGEAFDIYGNLGTFVTIGREKPVLVKIRPLARTGEVRAVSFAEFAQAPLRPDLLPPELQHFGRDWHGGSHAHLVHEFISSLVHGRPPYIDARRAASWCAPGICAHASAMKNGEKVKIPAF